MIMNKTLIIDTHVHAYPSEIFEDPQAWALAQRETHWAQLVAPRGDRPSLQGFRDGPGVVDAMAAASVDRGILAGWYWEQVATCDWHNAWMLRWMQEFPKRLLAFASVQPRAGRASLDALKRAVDQGFCGIGEVFPKAQGFAMQDSAWLEMVTWATHQRLPILMHVPEPVGRPYSGRVEAALSDYLWLVQEFPDTTFIFAHWGGGLIFYELNPYVRQSMRNVYYDTAASPLMYASQIYRVATQTVGAKRILYGSDYP
ncbi:MAG: hypothetical protein B7X06_01055, partial [Verrucomicrobia bacterium 21-51-4]